MHTELRGEAETRRRRGPGRFPDEIGVGYRQLPEVREPRTDATGQRGGQITLVGLECLLVDREDRQGGTVRPRLVRVGSRTGEVASNGVIVSRAIGLVGSDAPADRLRQLSGLGVGLPGRPGWSP